MAKINFVTGSNTVPGQADARNDQLRAQSGASGRVEIGVSQARDGRAHVSKGVDSEVMSVFGSAAAKGEDYGPNYGRQRIRFHKANDVNPYADSEDARLGIDVRMKKVIGLAVAAVLVFFLAAIIPTNVFDVATHPQGISAAEFLDELKAQVAGFFYSIRGGESFYSGYFWQMVAAALAGAALGLSGGVYQGALKNALASPSTLGVTSGGSLGLVIYISFFYPYAATGIAEDGSFTNTTSSPLEYIVTNFGMFFSSLLGCCVVVALILAIAYIAGRGHVSNVSLIIAGQVFSSVIGIVISLIQAYLIYEMGDITLAQATQNATSVSFNGTYSAMTVGVFAVPLLVCMAVVFAMSGRLALLAFSDEEARSMGISTTMTRNVMVGVCTALTALVISFTGPIGFVGFLVPHIARRMIGPDFRYLLPATAFIGAILVSAVNCFANLGIPGFESGGTGMFTSLIGCVFFLITALKSRGDKRAEWF